MCVCELFFSDLVFVVVFYRFKQIIVAKHSPCGYSGDNENSFVSNNDDLAYFNTALLTDPHHSHPSLNTHCTLTSNHMCELKNLRSPQCTAKCPHMPKL